MMNILCHLLIIPDCIASFTYWCPQDASRLLQPLLLMYLLEYFTDDSPVSTSTAYWLATGIVLCTVVEAFVGAQIVFNLITCGMTWQASVCGLIYRKVFCNYQVIRVSLSQFTQKPIYFCNKYDIGLSTLDLQVQRWPLNNNINLTLRCHGLFKPD